MIRERVTPARMDPGDAARALVPVEVRSHGEADRFIASAIAQGRIVAWFRQDGGGEYATNGIVVDLGTEAVVTFFSRASMFFTPYRAPSVAAGIEAVRGVLATHGAFNW